MFRSKISVWSLSSPTSHRLLSGPLFLQLKSSVRNVSVPSPLYRTSRRLFNGHSENLQQNLRSKSARVQVRESLRADRHCWAEQFFLRSDLFQRHAGLISSCTYVRSTLTYRRTPMCIEEGLISSCTYQRSIHTHQHTTMCVQGCLICACTHDDFQVIASQCGLFHLFLFQDIEECTHEGHPVTA